MSQFSKGSVTRYKLRPKPLALAWYICAGSVVVADLIEGAYIDAYWMVALMGWVCAWNWQTRTLALVRELAKGGVVEEQVTRIRVKAK